MAAAGGGLDGWRRLAEVVGPEEVAAGGWVAAARWIGYFEPVGGDG